MPTNSEPQAFFADDSRAWWLEALDLPATASAGEVRTRLLERIAAADFHPDRDVREAVYAFAGYDVNSYALRLGQEMRLREEIEKLAVRFFATPPKVRRSKFERLKARAQDYPNLLYRLHDLERGLDVEAERASELPGPEREIAEAILAWFPMPPSEQARTRRHMWEKVSRSPELYAAAANSLESKAPRICELDPHFSSDVLHWPYHERAIARKARRRRKYAERREAANQSGSESRLWVLLFCVMIFAGVVGRLSRNDRSPSQPDSNSLSGIESFEFRDFENSDGLPRTQLQLLAMKVVNPEEFAKLEDSVREAAGKIEVFETRLSMKIIAVAWTAPADNVEVQAVAISRSEFEQLRQTLEPARLSMSIGGVTCYERPFLEAVLGVERVRQLLSESEGSPQERETPGSPLGF
jgi:hypothetical protein